MLAFTFNGFASTRANNRVSFIISNVDTINNRLINNFYIFSPSTLKITEWQEVHGVKSQLVCLKPI